MVKDIKQRVLVVLTLSGGNDALNTLIPFGNPLYYDYRSNIGIPAGQVLPIDANVGFHPSMVELKEKYDQGKVAVIQGVGYPSPIRSHFRSMDIWHSCEIHKISDEGWLGRSIRDLDPRGENVLTGVNFGRGLPKSMAAKGVPVASVADIANYGVLTSIDGPEERGQALDVFARMYAPSVGWGPVMDYIWDTGRNALKGADILKTAPAKYTSTIEYGDDHTAEGLKAAAQVHLAELGTKIITVTTPYNTFDYHANEVPTHARLWREVSRAVSDFYQDLREHATGGEVLLFMFSEFGRRAWDNGGGTDHGTGGVCWIIGDHVRGGLYGDYPSLKREELEDGGDLQHNVDFRRVYATLIEKWLGLDSRPIVGGAFEQLAFLD